MFEYNKRRLMQFSLLLFLIFSTSATWAQSPEALLLYKSTEESSATGSRLNLKVEPILKAMGYQVRYHDINTGLPQVGQANAIVSWYTSPKMPDPEGYIDWLAQQTAQGKKVIILGNFGAHTADDKTWLTNESINRFFYPFGLSYGAAYTGDSSQLEITKVDGPAKTPIDLNYYLLFSSVNANNRVYLSLKRKDLANSESALVVQTPFGAMAQIAYVDRTDLEALVKSTLTASVVKTETGKKLLGLYKGSEGKDARSNFIARFAATPLYDLGYGLDYHDIETGLPSAQTMSRYQGVVSWYNTPQMPKAGDYVTWLAQQVESGRRVVVIGNWGAFAEDIPSSGGTVRRFLQSPEYNRFFYPFGLEFRAAWTPKKGTVSVVEKDPQVVTWLEPNHVGHYYWIRSVNPDNKSFLTVNRSDIQDGQSAVVVATPKGGLALESYVLGTDPSTKQPRMHIDLKKFLRQSLTLAGQDTPSPDTAATLKSKPRLPARPKPLVGGDGRYPQGIAPIKRKVLAFYSRGIDETATENSVYSNAELILDHLGLVVRYRAVEDPLPSDQEMADFRGVVVWMSTDNIPNARAFDSWLQRQIKNQKKVTIIGDYSLRNKDDLSLIDPQPVYGLLGFRFDPIGNAPLLNAKALGSFKKIPPRNPSVLNSDPAVVGFERAINFKDKDLKSNWHLVKAASKDIKVALTVKQTSGDSDVIAISPAGGIILGPFAVQDKGKDRKNRPEGVNSAKELKAVAEDEGGDPWRVDPYWFFTEAFSLRGLPRPDVTTLNGSRIYYSHIDGDAFGGISLIDRSSLNGEMMLKNVLRPLQLPITISYVTKDVEQRLDARYSRELEVAQEIFKLDHVEPASHTYSHPFDWEQGDLALGTSANGKVELIKKDIDIKKEIQHSVDFVDKLSPANKRCEILLWSGRCNPIPDAVRLVRELGLPNMNGAESVLDAKHPYLTGLKPLFGQVGEETQYHVSAAGDFYYTSSWTRNYDGMKNLPDYFNRTEAPHRLRCMNVYYHFYLAERQPGIEGLRIAYQDVLRRQPAPMFASDYTDILADSLETKLGTDSQGNYWCQNNGELRTVRFDNESRYPDLLNSKGLIGFNRANKDLYLHLDGRGEATIRLTDAPPTQVYIEKFSHRIDDLKMDKNGLAFTASGQGPAHLIVRNLHPGGTYRIDDSAGETAAVADSAGTLQWTGRLTGYKKEHPFRIRKISP